MKKHYIAAIIFLVSILAQSQNAADRDPAFNLFELTPDSYPYNGEYLYKVKSQQDGKLLTLFQNNKRMVRLDGNVVDQSFNRDASFNNPVADFVLQPDGKIVAIGSFTAFGSSISNRIIRLNADGTKDTGFSTLGFNAFASKLALQPDGKILVSGDFTMYNGVACGNLVRLNADASLDTTFNAGTGAVAHVILAQPDGKTVVAGPFTTFNGITAPGLIRLNANGTKDTTFAITSGFGNYVYTGVLQPDGKMLFGGIFTTYNGVAAKRLVRVNPNGSIDTTFATANGFTQGLPYSIVLQPDNKILVSGSDLLTFNGITGSKNIWRFNADGTIDSTFNAGTGFNNNNVRDLALKPDGKMAIVGSFALFNDVPVASIVELNADGTRNSNFNIITKGLNRGAQKTILQSDGKIVVYGASNSYNGFPSRDFVRLNPDGSYDNTFHPSLDTPVFLNSGEGLVMDLKVLPNDKMIVAGYFSNFRGTAINNICRLNRDGTIDSSFFSGIGFGGTNVNSVFIQNDGKIMVGGNFYNVSTAAYQGILRLNSDGTLDTTFPPCSHAYTPINSRGTVRMLVTLSDGKMLVSGQFDKFNNVSVRGLVRLNADGTVDSGFTVDPSLSTTNGYNFTVQPDGKIILYLSDMRRLIRLNANGSIDNTFINRAGPPILRFFNVRPDGKMLVLSGVVDDYYELERLNPDGSTDQTFDRERGFDYDVNDIVFQADGKMVVVGSFKIYNGLPENGIVRLLGEDMNFLSGKNKLDTNNNGCDDADMVFPNLRLTDSNGNTLICDTTGNYNFGMGDGSYTFTPAVENPSYFSVTPTSIAIDFPTQASPVQQNFCITPTGNHNDLNIVMFPIDVARPGFNSAYKIIVQNKGSLPLSGSFSLAYNEDVVNYVSSSMATSSVGSGNLQWNFTNLNPFESLTTTVVLNMNSPLANPPLNSGDVLNFLATIAMDAADETPSDNSFAFNQTVVNSFDPNDKICLEGKTVGIEKIGDYVHYQIRFENTGTWPAQNIKVTDVIDTDKFDISTLTPISGSHLYITNIKGNAVEFLFNDINLPYTDEANDGYLVFKIKTKSTLNQGDAFSNGASIFFDYNYPIVTDTATTTIAALATTDFSFKNYFTVSPNPVPDFLMLHNKKSIGLKSIEIFSVTGQRVLVIPNAAGREKLDVAQLKTGSYFIKIHTEKGSSNIQFLKK